MKVICIDTSAGTNTGAIPPFKEMELLTLGPCPFSDSACYVIEYPNDINGLIKYWYRYRFIPLSDIDETELIKERELLTISN